MQLSIAAFSAARPPLRVVDDYGPVGQGASNAREVRCSNGSEYLLKGRSLAPGHPYVAINERAAAELARFLDLPILAHEIVEWNGELLFGSQYMTAGTWTPNTTPNLFAQCLNKDCVYELAAFDAWICNTDRHSGNLLVRHARGSGSTDLLRLNDHSHVLVLPGMAPSQLGSLVGSPISRYFRLDYVREAITDDARLRVALNRVEAVSDALIDGILDGIPPSWWLAGGDRQAYRDLLTGRRTALRSLFDAERAIFPNLPAGGAAP